MSILKQFLIILFSLGLMPLTSISTHAQQNTPDLIEYIVIASSANLRSGPGTNFPVVATVVSGDTVLIYDEPPEVVGWLRGRSANDTEIFIADFLVQRSAGASTGFYSDEQTPLFEVSGRGRNITDVYEIPRGAYRIDATIQDNAFILTMTVVQGDCQDDMIFNELNFDVNVLEISGLLVSSGCSVVFEADNVDGNWRFALRDLLVDENVENAVSIENGTTISGAGRALTMTTHLPSGIWAITANVHDSAFILTAHPIGNCDEDLIFNEFDMNAESLDISAIYRSADEGCFVWWETANVEGNWVLSFERLD